VSGSGVSWAICKFAPWLRPITMPTSHHSVFYRLDALPATQPTASKHRNPFDAKLSLFSIFCPFNGLFSRTTWASQHQISTLFWILMKRDDGVAMAKAGPYLNNLHFAPDRQQHQHLITQFLQVRCSPWCPTNSVKALQANPMLTEESKYWNKINNSPDFNYLLTQFLLHL